MAHLDRCAPAARPPRYPVDRAALAARVAESQRTEAVGPALGADLTAIAAGVHDRFHYGPSKEEFVQECLAHFLGGPLRRCDPRRDVSAWLTACAIRLGDGMRTQRAAEEQRAAEYRAAVGRALRWKLGRGADEDVEPPS